MAAQSIVDFVKQSLVSVAPAAVGGAFAAPIMAPVANQAAELAYLDHGSQILGALRNSDGMTARELFEQIKSANFPALELAIGEMKARGLVQEVGRKPPFQDPIYSLAAGIP